MGEAGEEADKLRDPTHVRNYSEEEWREMFDAAGLDVEAFEREDKRIDFAAWLERSGTPDEDRAANRRVARRQNRGRQAPPRPRNLQGKEALVAIVVGNDTRLLVQGITGSEGSFHAVRNRDYGTNVVAGVTPGKGGQDVSGIPVFDTVADAVAETQANTTLVFVPARFAADAIYEAVDAGIETVICVAEGLAAHEMLRVYNYIRPKGITMLGPNCPGALSPGKANVGIIPAEVLREGKIGLVSRSGTLTYQIGYELAQLGLGNSTIVGIGGDPVVGSSFIDILAKFEADDETEVVVMVGEIGGDEEEKAAALHRRRDDEAGRRVHRRLHRAARQDDGPRRRDHLRLVGDGAGEEGSARSGGRQGGHDADRGRRAGGRDSGRPGLARSAVSELDSRVLVVEPISLARGVPAPECLPVAELADCARAAIESDGTTVLNYGPAGGYAPLREWIAERHGVEPVAGRRHERLAPGLPVSRRAPGAERARCSSRPRPTTVR